MDVVLSWKRFSQGIVDTFAEALERVWSRNVKMRFLVESPLENITAKELVRVSNKKPFCQDFLIINLDLSLQFMMKKKYLLYQIRSRICWIPLLCDPVIPA